MQPSQWLTPLTAGWQITDGQSGTRGQEPLAFWTLLELAVHSLVASLCCGLTRTSLSLLLKAVGVGTGLADSDILLRVGIGGGSGWDGTERFFFFLEIHTALSISAICV